MQLPLANISSSISQKIQAFLLARIPLARRTIFKNLYSDTLLTASQIDVDQVHAILDGTDVGNTNEYFALCENIVLGDSHLQGELNKRKLAILGDERVIGPVDKNNSEDVAAAKLATEMIDGLPSFMEACAALLDGTIWPLAVVEKVFRRATVNTKLSYEIDRLIRVPTRLFDYLTGFLRIWDTDPSTGAILSTKSDPDPMRYIIHRGHLLTTPDYRGGPMRALVFWSLFSNFDRDWWARFLDRYGTPFLVGKYDQADDASRVILEQAFQLGRKIGALAISRSTEVEIKEAMSRSGGEGFELFFKICQREKSKLIVGQTTSADAETGGMSGSSVAKEQAQVRGDIRQFDSIWLGNTLRYQLIDPFLKVNGIRGRVKISWGAEETESIVETSQAMSNFASAELEPTDEGIQILSARSGVPLQRKKIQQPPGGGAGGAFRPRAFSATSRSRFEQADEANGRIAGGKAAELARAFRGVYAPISRFILDSSSADELIHKIETHYADWDPQKVAGIILEALAAQAANGAVRDVETI